MKTVAILIPLNWEFVPRQFFFSMLKMEAYARGRYELNIFSARAAHLALMHEIMIQQVKDKDCQIVVRSGNFSLTGT